MFRKKVQPVPMQPREVKISRNPWKKKLKWFILGIFLIILGVGLWIGVSANRAIKNITTDGNNKSSLLSFLGDFNSTNIKGKSEGRTNILILGMGGGNHPGGNLSDTMIVASIDYKDNKLGLMNIPRDLWVPIPGFGHAKINEAYADGEKNKSTAGSGGQLSSKTVENILGIPIHYYLRLDFEGFKKLVDTVGGVDVYVEKDLSDPYYPADNMIDYSPFKISTGNHHLDGALALKYVRSRETTSDFDRSRRQQQVMAAVKEKILTLDILANPKKVTDLINILGDHIRTNMQVDELYALWNASKSIDMTNVTNKVLDTSPNGPLTSSQDYRGYYIYPRKGIDNFTELQLMAKNLFQAGSSSDINSAKVEILNGTSRSGTASTVSQYLKSYGYNVTKIDTARNKVSKTIVYDYSGGKYHVLAQAIADQLKASLDTKEGSIPNIDIQVIVGEDYLK
ncbi:MAG: LCP family protein [Patescibacteria group bacterium]|nr:LCP family protein [Patescibacteria group bacterium]